MWNIYSLGGSKRSMLPASHRAPHSEVLNTAVQAAWVRSLLGPDVLALVTLDWAYGAENTAFWAGWLIIPFWATSRFNVTTRYGDYHAGRASLNRHHWYGNEHSVFVFEDSFFLTCLLLFYMNKINSTGDTRQMHQIRCWGAWSVTDSSSLSISRGSGQTPKRWEW